jgi:hypothetical protein
MAAEELCRDNDGKMATMLSHRPTLQEHFNAEGSKRILSLDGGGVRGILSLGFLLQIETLLQARHGNDPHFRLCHYFDLIAGTSTGSIIAALLAKGWLVQQVIDLYLELAGKIFTPRWWEFRLGILRPRYDPSKLEEFLQQKLGAECRIGDPDELKTGLLVMCKRIDSGSPWPISNNPKGRYFQGAAGRIANGDFKLWAVVRASTAAPTFFQPQKMTISSAISAGQKPVIGNFMDGGVSPHNNPALQAYWLATLEGFGLRWATGQDRLLIISVGTGRTPVERNPGPIAALQGITALQSLMDDCASVVESLMQGMGHCLGTPRIIDPELRSLSPHELSAAARYSYARYDVKLYRERGDRLPRDGQDDNPHLEAAGLSDGLLKQMQKMDNPKPVEDLLNLGRTAAAVKVQPSHFPQEFDLPLEAEAPISDPLSGCSTFRQREERQVTAIRLNLDLEAFAYRKWGGLQKARSGDWLVERNGKVHTVNGDIFARTYRQIAPATYVKQSIVWAKPAESDGAIHTNEGETHYRKGDYLVWNDQEGRDGYAISREVFESLYEPVSMEPPHA